MILQRVGSLLSITQCSLIRTFKDWIRSDILEVICSTSSAMAESVLPNQTWDIVQWIARLVRIAFQLGFDITISYFLNQDSDFSLWIPFSIDLISLKNWATVISASTGFGLISTSLADEFHLPRNILDCLLFHVPCWAKKWNENHSIFRLFGPKYRWKWKNRIQQKKSNLSGLFFARDDRWRTRCVIWGNWLANTVPLL